MPLCKGSESFAVLTPTRCILPSNSPELVMDSHRDYVLYASDPIESFRAAQRQASGSAGSRNAGTSPSKSHTPHPAAFMVGKGFLSRALAEGEDGLSFVHGRVKSEYSDDEEDDEHDDEAGEDDEGSLGGKVLEVSLRFKEAPVSTRERYDSRVKVLQDANPSFVANSTLDQARNDDDPTHESAKNLAEDRSNSQTSSPQEQLLQLLQALQAQTQASEANKGLSRDAGTNPEHLSKKLDIANSSLPPDASPDMLSHLLKTLSAPPQASVHTPTESASSEKVAWPGSSMRQSVEHPGSASRGRALLQSRAPLPQSDAESPILGGLTPGYEVDYLSTGPSPTYSASATPFPAKANSTDQSKQKDKASEKPKPRPCDNAKPVGAHRHKQCCYNCGVSSQSSWRHLRLPDESVARFKEGSSIIDHGKRLYRACNACGLYFIKYHGVSRPEHVWRESQKKNRMKKLNGTASGGSSKAESAAESDAADDEGPSSTTSFNRRNGMSRTLSEACARDSERISQTADSKPAAKNNTQQDPRHDFTDASISDIIRVRRSLPARKTLDFESARMKDLVLDGDGNWRTKRSILENPAGRRPGRPKGIKTGKGLGRTRVELNLQKKEAERKAREAKLQAAAGPATSPAAPKRPAKEPAQRPTVAASSPVRPSIANFSYLHSKTPLSGGKMRYGAPSYLLDSSPATAFQTVMDEADTDWKALFGLSPRRSPRKNPGGVHAQVNPYASMASTSPIRKPASGMEPSALFNMASSSPLTRSRVRSGHFDWAFTSSDDAADPQKRVVSSAITSPASPSPSRSRNGSDKRRQSTMTMQLEAGPAAVVQERAAKRQKSQEDTSLGAGAFLCLGEAATSLQAEQDEDDGAPGSPTLGRSRRLDKKKRDGHISKAAPSPATSATAHCDKASSAPGLDFSNDWTRSVSMRELFPTPSPGKKWARSPSHAVWESPTAWALRDPTPSPVKQQSSKADAMHGGSKTKAIDESSQMQGVSQESVREGSNPAKCQELQVPGPSQQLVRRKPLPATVEDASPSEISNRSPTDDDDEDDGDDECALQINPHDSTSLSTLMELFEDPYGLLKASGLGLQSKTQVTGSSSPAKRLEGRASDDTAMALASSSGGTQSTSQMSADHFAQIELFKSFDFAQQLDFFTENGSNGVAAHVEPSTATASTIQPLHAPLKLEGKGVQSTAPYKDLGHTSEGSTPSKASSSAPLLRANSHGTEGVHGNDEANFALWLNDNKLDALWANAGASDPAPATESQAGATTGDVEIQRRTE